MRIIALIKSLFKMAILFLIIFILLMGYLIYDHSRGGNAYTKFPKSEIIINLSKIFIKTSNIPKDQMELIDVTPKEIKIDSLLESNVDNGIKQTEQKSLENNIDNKENIAQVKDLNFYHSYERLNDKIINLEKEIEILKRNSISKEDKIYSSIVLSLIRMEQKLEEGVNFDNELRQIKILTAKNSYLFDLVSKIDSSYKISDYKTITSEFDKIKRQIYIEDLKQNQNFSFSDKVQYLLGKMIIIRKKDGSDLNGDMVILNIMEKSLKNRDFSNVVTEYNHLSLDYQQMLAKWILDVDYLAKTNLILSEIIGYIENLSLNDKFVNSK